MVLWNGEERGEKGKAGNGGTENTPSLRVSVDILVCFSFVGLRIF